MANIPQKNLENFINDLTKVFINRKAEIHILATALIAEENAVLVGPHGTSKSLLVDSFAKALDGNFFQYLITRFTTPDELFGHFSLKQLKDNDEYIRKYQNKLPDANVAFLDECFKASSSLQNSLLTILNERAIDLGNGTRQKTDLQMVVGASNEYPFDDSSLLALWDRWLFRRHVGRLKKTADVWRVMTDPSLGKCSTSLSVDDINEIRKLRDQVDLTPVKDFIEQIHIYTREKDIDVSGRRWRKVAKVIRSRAAMAGRDHATAADLRILSEILWNRPEQRDDLCAFLSGLCSGDLKLAMSVYDKIKSLCENTDMDSLSSIQSTNTQIKSLLQEIDSLDLNDSEVLAYQSKAHALSEDFVRAFTRMIHG